VIKIWTTWEAFRVSLLMQKQSREWYWQSYTIPTASSSLLMDITFGGYVIITAGFFLGHVIGDPTTRGVGQILNISPIICRNGCVLRILFILVFRRLYYW
jgi:hypothetical protein